MDDPDRSRCVRRVVARPNYILTLKYRARACVTIDQLQNATFVNHVLMLGRSDRQLLDRHPTPAREKALFMARKKTGQEGEGSHKV